MEALGLPSLNTLTISLSKVWQTTHCPNFSDPSSLKFKAPYRTHHSRWSIRAAADEDYWLKGSTKIPIFDVDTRFDAGTVSRKDYLFHDGTNSQFLSKVVGKFPKDTDLIVVCQKGLRC